MRTTLAREENLVFERLSHKREPLERLRNKGMLSTDEIDVLEYLGILKPKEGGV